MLWERDDSSCSDGISRPCVTNAEMWISSPCCCTAIYRSPIFSDLENIPGLNIPFMQKTQPQLLVIIAVKTTRITTVSSRSHNPPNRYTLGRQHIAHPQRPGCVPPEWNYHGHLHRHQLDGPILRGQFRSPPRPVPTQPRPPQPDLRPLFPHSQPARRRLLLADTRRLCSHNNPMGQQRQRL